MGGPTIAWQGACHSKVSCVIHLHPNPLSWIVVAAIAAAGAIVGLMWAGVAWKTPTRREAVGTVCGLLLGLAAVTFLALLGLPYVLAFIRGTIASFSAVMPPATQASATHRSTLELTAGAGAGLLGVIASVFGWMKSALKNPSPVEKAAGGWLRRFVLARRVIFINALAAVTGPLLALAFALIVLDNGAARPPWVSGTGPAGRELLWWTGPLVVLVLIYWLADLNSWSLHPYYKQHLSEAFALARVKDPKTDSRTAVDTPRGRQDAEPRNHECPYPLSKCQPEAFPQVLICAAANVNEYGAIPTGFNAASFVFSAEEIGGDVVGKCEALAYERSAPRQVTLPAAVAVAGAAISPEMGKMTRAPLRFLLTVANLRLGVWLPNPAIVDRRTREGRLGQGRLLFPKPRPRYLFRELLGRNHPGSHFLYITDGGHYENLGLMELLRRKCRWIICIDGSGESVDSFGTIGEAFALARSELGVVIHLDPRAAMAPAVGEPKVPGHPQIAFARSTHAKGTITYKDGTIGTLIVVKAGVTEDAPWEVRAFQEAHPSFPCDPTVNQFFTAEHFDAYRTLGEFATTQALMEGASNEPRPDGAFGSGWPPGRRTGSEGSTRPAEAQKTVPALIAVAGLLAAGLAAKVLGQLWHRRLGGS